MTMSTSKFRSTSKQRRVPKRVNWLGAFILYGGLLLLSLFFLYPLVWMIVSSFKTGQEIATRPLTFAPATATLDNYRMLLRNVPLYIGFKNTGIVLIFKGALMMFFSPLAGFAFAKFRFAGRDALFTIVLATMMLPPVVMLIPLLLQMGRMD